jgi:HPt (histidine-containing phosphotransfer) domain-containing protein
MANHPARQYQEQVMSNPARIPAVLDRAAFAQLCAALPHDKMRELVELFVCETELYMTQIVSRRAEGNLESVARLSRNIVSVAGNLCAMRASALARQLERACRNGEKANSYHLIGEMSQACRDASEDMQAWLEEQTRSSSPFEDK